MAAIISGFHSAPWPAAPPACAALALATGGGGYRGMIYRQTTRSIVVTVEPFYLEEQSRPDQHRWVFGYRVKIENDGEETVRLISRHWRITDGSGRMLEVKGDGVVGEQPRLEPGQSFEYTSGTPLGTPSGIMRGTYQMLTDSGEWFDVGIPAFSLDAPSALRLAN